MVSMKSVAMLPLYRETDDWPILVTQCEAHCHYHTTFKWLTSGIQEKSTQRDIHPSDWWHKQVIIIIPHACLGLTASKTIKQYYILFALPATCPALFPHLSGGGILLLLWRHTALARAAPRFQSWAGLSFWGSTPFCRIATAWPPSLPVCLQARALCLFLKLYNIRIKFIHQVEDLARLQLHLLVLPNYDWVNAGGIDPYLWSDQKMIIIAVLI